MTSRFVIRTAAGITTVALGLGAMLGLPAWADEPKPQEQPRKQLQPRLQQAPAGTQSPADGTDPNATPHNHVQRDPKDLGLDALREVSPLAPDDGVKVVEITPMVLNLGDIPAGTQQASSTVKLRNISDKPVKLIECKADCGCTTAKCPRGHDILPGEEIEVEVQVNPGLKGQPMFRKTVTFKIEGQRDTLVTVNARVIEYIVVEPAEIDTKNPGEGKITLRSIDEQPFVVKEVLPDAFDGITEEAKPVHELTFSQERWDAIGKGRRTFNFLVDHPKTKSVQARAKVEEMTGPGLISTPAAPPGPEVALFESIRSGNVEGALKTIEGGVAVDVQDSSGRTALSLAAERGDVPMMKALIDKAHAKVETGDRAGFTALTYAVQAQSLDGVRLLLDRGANPNSRDDTAGTPLMWASGPRGFAEGLRLLLDAGADVQATNTIGMTAMSWAGGFADAQRIKMLAEAGADVNVFGGPDDMTPLMWAVQVNTPEAVQALIEVGADVKAKDGARRTAMEYALDRSDSAGPEIVKLLVAAGATPPKTTTSSGATPNVNVKSPATAPAKAPGN